MTTNDYIIKNLRESACMRIAVLFGSFFIFLILVSFLSGVIDTTVSGSTRSHALLTAFLQCLFVFSLPAFILARYCSNRPLTWLCLNKSLKIKPILGVLIIYIVSLPAMEWLIAWNNDIHFPESLIGLEQTLRAWEESNGDISNRLLEAHGFFQVLIGVIIIGIFTGISEELFFRGGLQGIFSRAKIGIESSVWLAAFIFSCMHFQFFGFFPRLLMGAFFGYLLVWTGDLKISAIAHILNNSIVVIIAGFTDGAGMNIVENRILPDYSYLPLISLIVTTLFLIFFRGYFFKTSNTLWQKRPVRQYIRK